MSSERERPYVAADAQGWPMPPDASVSEPEKLLYSAELEVRKKRTDAEIARAAAEANASLALEKAFFDGIVSVATGSIERARASADFVQKAAGAIATVYAAILGVSFSVAERPFPARGILPVVFLGTAIVCATVFLAWIQRSEGNLTHDDSPAGTTLRDRLTRLFIRWNRRTAVQRRKWLRAGVVALGAAIVLLPAAFIPLGKRASAATVTLPSPAAAAPSENIELRKILYQEQLNQATKVAKSPVTGRYDWIWWVIAGGLGVLVIVLAQFPRDRRTA